MLHQRRTSSRPSECVMKSWACCALILMKFCLQGSQEHRTRWMFLTKRKLTQAPALTVPAVKVFEDVCINSQYVHKRVIAGSILFCIFSAAFWFDSMFIDETWENKFGSTVLLEANTEKHKTSMTKEAKTCLLPFVCLGRFLADIR